MTENHSENVEGQDTHHPNTSIEQSVNIDKVAVGLNIDQLANLDASHIEESINKYFNFPRQMVDQSPRNMASIESEDLIDENQHLQAPSPTPTHHPLESVEGKKEDGIMPHNIPYEEVVPSQQQLQNFTTNSDFMKREHVTGKMPNEEIIKKEEQTPQIAIPNAYHMQPPNQYAYIQLLQQLGSFYTNNQPIPIQPIANTIPPSNMNQQVIIPQVTHQQIQIPQIPQQRQFSQTFTPVIPTRPSPQKVTTPTTPPNDTTSKRKKRGEKKEKKKTTKNTTQKKRTRAKTCQRWTEEQNRLLRQAVLKYGPRHWKKIAEEIGGIFTADQCNQHWHRVLNPRIIKGDWTPEEDELLFERVGIFGESAWTKVAEGIPGRTDIQCRHRYFQRKKEMQQGITRNKSSVNDYNQRKDALSKANSRNKGDLLSNGGETSSNMTHFTYCEKDYFSDDDMKEEKFVKIYLKENFLSKDIPIVLVLQPLDENFSEKTEKRKKVSVNRMRGNLNVYIPWCEAEEQILQKEILKGGEPKFELILTMNSHSFHPLRTPQHLERKYHMMKSGEDVPMEGIPSNLLDDAKLKMKDKKKKRKRTSTKKKMEDELSELELMDIDEDSRRGTEFLLNLSQSIPKPKKKRKQTPKKSEYTGDLEHLDSIKRKLDAMLEQSSSPNTESSQGVKRRRRSERNNIITFECRMDPNEPIHTGLHDLDDPHLTISKKTTIKELREILIQKLDLTHSHPIEILLDNKTLQPNITVDHIMKSYGLSQEELILTYRSKKF